MTTLTIPAPLHDVLGARQTPTALASTGAALVVVPLALLAARPEEFGAVPGWRAALALLLIADIAAGAVANLTAGTNDHYAARPRHRRTFVAVHVHLPVVAVLLDLPVVTAVVVWAATVAATVLVTVLGGRPEQRVAAGLAFVLLATAVPLLPGTPVLSVTAVLFAFKVVLAFGVDHRAGCRVDHGPAPAAGAGDDGGAER